LGGQRLLDPEAKVAGVLAMAIVGRFIFVEHCAA